ncbi:MAG: S8 family peptidase [Acidobacteriota bacterium]
MRYGVCLALLFLFMLLLNSCAGEKEAVPDDPYFKWQFALHNPGGKYSLPRVFFRSRMQEVILNEDVDIDAPEAWGITTGSRGVIVAILDDGFHYRHQDLVDNLWHNPGETGVDAKGNPKENNGIDDDHNGYIDDLVGYDFVFDDADPDPYIFDGKDQSKVSPYWHGTECAGIIGARGNNGRGIAGINWKVSLMYLKIGAQGDPSREDYASRDMAQYATRAIRYAADMGARIINWSGFVSMATPEEFEELKEAIDYAAEKGMLLVTGAGNYALNLDEIEDPQTVEERFNVLSLPNILRVACVDLEGNLETYYSYGRKFGSNYGKKRVDMAAPGAYIPTTMIMSNGQDGYRLFGGTSAAAPIVSGVAALVLSVNPDLTPSELKELLVETCQPVESIGDTVRSGGMVNAYQAVMKAQEMGKR